MAMLLRAEDAKDWIYKGEGAANIVLSYRGSSLFLLGKVLRIQKVPKGSTKSVNGCAVLSRHEKLLWGDVEELVESKSKDIAQQNYIKHVMSHMLGPKYIDEGTYVTVSREFLESVEKNVHDQRPAWRINAAEVDTSCDSAFLISDHSVFTGTPRGDFCVAVEIKPKCGFLPSSEFITKANAIKKSVTRFRMHQFLKLHQGEISNISEYNPLDLFSGSKDRIYQAITTLFATPQNNFRIFLNGSLIFGGLGGGMDSAAVRSHEENTAIKDLIKVSGLQLPGFLELVAEAIFSSGVLDKLLATQKLDVLDIEGAIHAYYNIISQPCMVCKNLGDPELLDQYSLLHSFPLDKSLKILRDYLIAATAKDCSLMISFRPVQGGSAASGYNSIFLESSNQNFEYKAYFIDLDMKPLEKMVHYYELDQKIVIFYMKSKDLGGSLCDSITQGDIMRRRGRYAGVQFQFSQTEAGTSSSTQQPEASSAAQHSESCPSSSAQHDPPVHQSDDEIHMQDGSGRVRPRRGPTVVRDVWQMREGERIVVECNQLGQPIKKAACLLTSFLGTVARRPQLCPLGYAKWNDMLPTYKVELLRVIESKFVLPPSTHDFVMKSLNRKWKEYRAQLKKDYMRQGMTEEEVARNCPPDVPPHQWMELVHYWFSERAQTYSAIGRAARAAQSVPHTSGSKSYARLRQEFVDEHGREPGQVEFYRMTHTHQDGIFVRDESRDLYERATSLVAERDDESAASTQQSRIEAEVFTELLGPERYGRVRGYGIGVTPTQLSEVSRYTQHAAADAQDSCVRRLEAEIQEIRQSRAAEMEEMRQSRAEMQAMRGQIDRLTSLLEMYGPSQAPGTSGTRRDSGTSRGDNDDHPPAD